MGAILALALHLGNGFVYQGLIWEVFKERQGGEYLWAYPSTLRQGQGKLRSGHTCRTTGGARSILRLSGSFAVSF